MGDWIAIEQRPEFMWQPIYQFVLIEGSQEHSGQVWFRKFYGTAFIDGTSDNRFGYRREDIDRLQRDGDMIIVERVSHWMPATFPAFPKSADPRSSERAQHATTDGSSRGEGMTANASGTALSSASPIEPVPVSPVPASIAFAGVRK